jgi:FG-GAP-like repeat
VYRLLAVALIMLSVASVSGAAGAPEYSRSPLTLSGRLLSVASDDMDGDGLKDIIAVSLRGDRAASAVRQVEVFLQKKGGTFGPRPDASWPMPSSAAVFDTGAVDNSGRRSVLYIAPDGVYAFLPDGAGYAKKPVRIIKADSVFTGSDPLDLPHYDFFVERAGVPAMALVPEMSGLAVYEREGGSFRHTSGPSIPVRTSFSDGRPGEAGGLTVSHGLPAVTVQGYNSPASADIVASWDDNALVFLRGADGRYNEDPDVRFAPGLLTVLDKGPLEGAWLFPADFDGDGRMDAAVVKKTGGLARTKSLIFIYIRKGDTFPPKPASTIITEGVVGPRFVDLNGDGRLDVLLPSIKVGISNFVNMLTSGKVNVDVDIYMQGKDGSFPDRPTKTKSIGFKLDLTNLAKAAPVLETGRFSAGGYGLAVVSGDKSVSLYLPDQYSILSDRPGVELAVDAPTGMDVEDLNGDKIDDFVLTYKGSGTPSALNVFVSKP